MPSTMMPVSRVEVDEDLNMNGKKAINADDATAATDLITKEQMEETAEQLAKATQWQATQW